VGLDKATGEASESQEVSRVTKAGDPPSSFFLHKLGWLVLQIWEGQRVRLCGTAVLAPLPPWPCQRVDSIVCTMSLFHCKLLYWSLCPVPGGASLKLEPHHPRGKGH
jgi:hypothetical protein